MKRFKVVSSLGSSFILASKIEVNAFGQVEFYDEDKSLIAIAPVGALVRIIRENENVEKPD